jgi:uncharacterized membrane protein (UPF0136 family)
MAGLLQILIALYALFLVIGGVTGYVRSRSVASLIAGVLFGALEMEAFVLAFGRPRLAFQVGAMLAALLALTTFPRFLKNSSRFMPTGLLLVLSVVMAILLAFGWARAA